MWVRLRPNGGRPHPPPKRSRSAIQFPGLQAELNGAGGQLCDFNHTRRCRDCASPLPGQRSQGTFFPPHFPARPRPASGAIFSFFRLARRVHLCAASTSLESNSATAERSFFRIVLALSWRNLPPKRRCAAGERSGASLEGIPPTVPSLRPAPPPRVERAIPLSQNKKGTK